MLRKSLCRLISANSMQLNSHLRQVDPEVTAIIDKEFDRQKKSVVLIASENFAPVAVLDAVGSVLTNKYSEGYPGARYYGGNEFIDQMESLCQQRALQAFNVSPEQWGVNCQALSGSPANFAVYSALLEPNDRIMALDLPHGGHLSHGYQTPQRKVSMVSKFWQSMPYRLNESTGLIDYDECELFVKRFRPKLLICGASAYARHIDFARFRKIADSVGAILLADIAHISGLVAAGVHPSPFPHVDIVTTTTHKTLRGPRGALIFFRRGIKTTDAKTGQPVEYDFEKRINLSVFPGLQGGPHEHTISGIAVALKLAQSDQFKKYQLQVLSNCQALAAGLVANGVELVSGGTDNHLLLIDLRNFKTITGNQVEKVCDHVGLALNKNTVPGDRSAVNPSGLRVGTPAMTSRGAVETDFSKVAEYIVKAIHLTRSIVDSNRFKNLGEFTSALNETSTRSELNKLKIEVESFASKFESIGTKPL
jgi:glycine hydroxymethyltransferase